MKASQDFILREVLDEYLLIPAGAAAARVNGMISLNEIGAFVFRLLREEQTEDTLVGHITREYRTDADTARKDLEEFLGQLRSVGALIE